MAKNPSPASAADREQALSSAMAQIEKQFGRGAIMRLGRRGRRRTSRCIPTGLDRPGRRPGHRRAAARPHRGDLRPGVQRQDDRRAARHRQRPESGRDRGLHRRRARPRPDLRQRLGVDLDEPAASASRTTASRRWRSPRRWSGPTRVDLIVIDSVAALVPQGRDRGRDGRQPCRPAGPADEPGAAQDDRRAEHAARRPRSSSTSCGRRSASCSATRRPPPAGRR